MSERRKTNSVVLLILLKENADSKEVLLQLRQNTGYMDDMWDMAATGHVEANEKIEDAALREAREELDIIIDKKDIKLVSLEHKATENYYLFFFLCSKYVGNPKISEPDKCTSLVWFDFDFLPVNIIEHNKRAIEKLKNNIFYEIN